LPEVEIVRFSQNPLRLVSPLSTDFVRIFFSLLLNIEHDTRRNVCRYSFRSNMLPPSSWPKNQVAGRQAGAAVRTSDPTFGCVCQMILQPDDCSIVRTRESCYDTEVLVIMAAARLYQHWDRGLEIHSGHRIYARVSFVCVLL
jgi:hypothetical protein